MKKILLSLSIAIFLVACSTSNNKSDNSDNSEKLSTFLSNFKTLQLPISAETIKNQATIETDFLDILTDTTGGFSRNYPDGKMHFTNEYYYLGKIESDNKDFHIIIVGEMPTNGVLGLMPGALLEVKLYTISTKGKLISTIPFAYFGEGQNWGMTGSINKNLEIETKEDKTVKKYKIEKTGKITETVEEGNKEFQSFIAESFKPKVPVFNSDRFRMINQGISEKQLIFVANKYLANTDEITCYNPVVFEMPKYIAILLTYNDNANELAKLITVDKNGKIISQKEEIYYFGERAESGFIEIEPLEDNTIFVTSKIVTAKKHGNETIQTGTNKYYKIDKNGKLAEADMLNTFIDNRDGKRYKVVQIGEQLWLAENFAYKPKDAKFGSLGGNYWAYDDKVANIKKYGYLYDWETAQKIVPQAWHLPTKEDFETLIMHYGEKPFSKLSQEEEGLNIIYSGWFYEESMAFAHEGNEAGFWSATKKDDKEAWTCIFQREFKHVIIRNRFMRGVGASVRLVQNAN